MDSNCGLELLLCHGFDFIFMKFECFFFLKMYVICGDSISLKIQREILPP